MASSTNYGKFEDLLNDKVGPTGDEKSAAMFLFSRIMGLKLMDYNLAEEEYFRGVRASKSNREFRAAINKMRRDEYAKGYPDYEELDARIMELYSEMLKSYNEIYKIEEE
jgi:Txe/YoeB family toxin of Txe-Axe toxin-antitoxin module